MNKVLDKPVKIGEHRTRHTFRVYDDPSEAGSEDQRRRQVGFLKELTEQPAMLFAGPTYATKMAIWHDGTCWVLSGEAEADDA